MNSKYVAGAKFIDSSSINLRLNSGESWSTDFVLPVSFYIDCYASGKIGGQNYQSSRLKRRQEVEFPVGALLSSAADSTCYIYGADMIQTFKGLANVYPNEADFNNAYKLRELELGSDADGYYNPQLTKVNIGAATMLQKVFAQNVGTRDGLEKLDLTKIKQLTDLRIDGSSFNGLALANGSIIDNLRLNDLKDLSVENMSKLTTDNLYIDENIYNTLTKLKVVNSPAFNELSYRSALSDALIQYHLNDVHWTITSADDLIYDDSNNVVGILALESLLGKDTIDNIQNPLALTGKVTIDVACTVKEYALYERYAGKEKYPDVIFEYTDKVTKIDPTAELRFMAGPEENADLFYRVLGKKNQSKIGFLISADGPTGIAIDTPAKSDTSEWTYTFTGYWIDANDHESRYYVHGLENPVDGAQDFDEVTVAADMTFYPEFKEEKKKHQVKFFDYEGNVISQNGEDSFGVYYGQTYASMPNAPMTNFYYKDSSNLPAEKRYGFKGWSTSFYKVDEGRNMEYFDLENDIVTKAMNLYPYYVTEDVREVASSEEYFEVIDGAVVLKDKYKETLQGKITVPNMPGAKAIGKFFGSATGNYKVTHIYFLRNCTYNEVNISAFSYNDKLEIVALPSTIKKIHQSAFTNCENLTTVSLNDNITLIDSNAFNSCTKLNLTSLPKNLESIGMAAFMSCGEGLQITSIPGGVKTIPSYTFYGCPNVKISNFGSDDSSSQLTTIGQNAFNNAGNGNIGPNVTTVYINHSVTTVDKQAFTSYSKSTLDSVYFKRPYENSEYICLPKNGENGMGFDHVANIGYLAPTT